jgi:hypothetical protein
LYISLQKWSGKGLAGGLIAATLCDIYSERYINGRGSMGLNFSPVAAFLRMPRPAN